MVKPKESEPRVIQERISPRAIEAHMSNYRDAQQAFMELIDNAVDNRIEGEPLSVRITVGQDELSVFNKGGTGLDFEGLEDFFFWGQSQKDETKIGHYGVGGKAAMGFLGRSMEIACSPKGSNIEYKVRDNAWETRSDELKQLDVEERQAAGNEGYFRVRISNLKEGISAQALATKLSDVYAPLLRAEQVKISVNGRTVEPLEINYVEDDPNLKPQSARVQTRFENEIPVKVGILQEGQKVKPGIRCYYRGRLIESEQFFGHKTPAVMPQASKLIGEAHLDNIPVSSNKSTFNHSSPQWAQAQKRLHDFLIPWYEKLANIKMEHLSHVEGFEKELARNAKRVLEHVFSVTGAVTKSMLPGESSGRRPPTPGEPRPKSTGSRPEKPRNGRTAPNLEAGTEAIKRWGAMFRWEITSMGNIDKRSEVVDVNGQNVLKINADFPLYQAKKKAGEDALELYMAETGIMKIAEIVSEDRSIEEFLSLVNGLLRDCGEVYQGRLRNQRTKRGK